MKSFKISERIAHLAGVFILEEYQGLGLGKWLMGNILDHTQMRNIKKWAPVTKDAHELYRKF